MGDVHYLNLHSKFWKESDQAPYNKLVFINPKIKEIIFIDLDNTDESKLCLYLVKKEIRYLTAKEGELKVNFWREIKQEVLVARVDDFLKMYAHLEDHGDISEEEFEKNSFSLATI